MLSFSTTSLPARLRGRATGRSTLALLLGCTVAGPGLAAPVVRGTPATLVALWELDGDFTATDPAWNGVASGGVTFVQGITGMAAHFDHSLELVSPACDCNVSTVCTPAASSVDHVDTLQKTAASEFAGGITVMGWIRPEDPVGAGGIVNHSPSCCGKCYDGWTFGWRPATGELNINLIGTTGSINAETAQGIIPLGCWTHVAFTWDGSPTGGVSFYVNGTQVPTTYVNVSSNFSGLDTAGLLPTRIGANLPDSIGTVQSFDGAIDHLSLWDGALTASEVLDDYESTSVPASCTFRNGMDCNPVDFTCKTPPAIGTDWESCIATTVDTVLTVVDISLGGPTSGTKLPPGGAIVGEVLGLPPYKFFLGAGMHSIKIPCDGSLIGAALYSKGSRFDLDPDTGQAVLILLNAQDLVLGL